MCQKMLKANGGSGDTALHKVCRSGRSVSWVAELSWLYIIILIFRTWSCTTF